MARFFFDLVDSETTVRDEQGMKLLDLSTARARASIMANAAIDHVKSPSKPYDPREVHIRTEKGKCVAKIAFRYVTA